MLQFVDALSLNVRSQPVVSLQTKLGALFLGTKVDVTGAADAAGFVPANVTLDGNPVSGFLAERFLRTPVSDSREALVTQAIEQWLRFDRGLAKEQTSPFFRFIGEMYDLVGLHGIDGRDRDVPWSAAAISFMVRRAGKTFHAYDKFKFASAHARYIHDSIVKREAGDKATPFWGFRLGERRPQLGDLVCKWREHPMDFDGARHSDAFKSHCDIVVSIDSAANTLLAIGGNVAQSVSVTTYHLTAGDFLADRDNVFALLANIADRP